MVQNGTHGPQGLRVVVEQLQQRPSPYHVPASGL